jgi:1-acyl-sn-glycerol-3-phosphate acyltransferase
MRLTPPQVFLVASGLTLVGAVYAYWLMPAALLRFVLWLLTRTLYCVRVEGRDNIPDKGARSSSATTFLSWMRCC